MAGALTIQEKASNIRTLLYRSKDQMASALPKHLTAERLLRVAMTSIQKTPKLMDCTQQSLLACVMTCAQLGLEPDQFLGQAYLVPFKDRKKNDVLICTLIPGYRGYIALARRSGELQTVSAQVVYSKDFFNLQYGIEDRLEHRPPLDGSERGEPIGAYCVFKYKDGGYSFDFMSKSDIEKIRKRSQTATEGPWVTDWDEMAKKTVIKRHAKLAPLSVEFQRAVALEDRAMSGEAQDDLLAGMEETGVIDIKEDKPDDLLKKFDASIVLPRGITTESLDEFLRRTAESNKTTVEAVKQEAAKDGKTLAGFWKFFLAWEKQEKAKKKVAAPKDDMPARFECPADGKLTTLLVCDGCKTKDNEDGTLCTAFIDHGGLDQEG